MKFHFFNLILYVVKPQKCLLTYHQFKSACKHHNKIIHKRLIFGCFLVTYNPEQHAEDTKDIN